MRFRKIMSVILSAVLITGASSAAMPFNTGVTVSAATYSEYFKNTESSNYAKSDIAVSAEAFELIEGNVSEHKFIADETALYALKINYTTIKENDKNIEFKTLIDGTLPFDEAKLLELDRYYKDEGGVRTDANGNESYAYVKEVYGTYEKVFKDSNGAEYLCFEISAGEHTFALEGVNGNAIVNSIALVAIQEPVTYKEYLKKDGKDYSGEQIVLEAEGKDLSLKDNEKIVGLSDTTSANISPSDYKTNKINYTGGPNWSQPGDTISWKISVKESGYYNIAVNYKQSYTLNTTFYRELRINGEVPFKEAKNITFPYARNWTVMTLGNDDCKYKFYFEAGKEYELSLSVTLGPLSELTERLDATAEGIASLYRDIVMVTGESVDANRDYNLFKLVENWDARLKKSIEELDKISVDMKEITGSNGSSTISTINNLRFVLNEMYTDKYSAHKQVDSLYSYYASLCSLMGELRKMPLDIDRFILAQPDSKITGIKSNVFSSFVFGVNKFIWSFVDDYKVTNTEDREKITIWVNWGRDQTKVLKSLIQSEFSNKHNIDVDIKVTNATLTHAMLSGNGPDLMLHISRSEPVNLAMRDALYDLTNFDGTGEYADLPAYDDILTRFADTASVPYWFERDGHNGLYALPDTQTFFMMFIRDDIFAEMGLSVPKTWEEFNSTAVTLLRNNMLVGMPYTQIVSMEQVNVGAGALTIFPTFMVQHDRSFYTEDNSATDMLDKEVINLFEGWTDYYTKYGFLQTYDFFNRFRVGLMPMAIQGYTNYANLSAAATEISGNWSMYEIPGVMLEDGTIDNRAAGGGTGAGILSTSENKAAAWEFLCWWTSADTQYQYCTEVESILGPAARVATANVEALKKFEWESNNLDALLKQWEKIDEIPEVPGGYSVARIIDQAFWNTVNGGEDVQDMLIKWTKIADGVIERKRDQYGLSKEDEK